ncbi:MAG: UDP-N-acetylmuramate--L-alanine ligase [Patescibacteria group bacterium]|jgi:UDP-N-acetylmuramate--alanine ligase|nr:UDP-N-acetylmuramate--L-alanine ligase [Patescibacteria group bacterium]
MGNNKIDNMEKNKKENKKEEDKNKKNKSAYFIGIKGVGMTMFAQFLKKKGWNVSGSDIPEIFLTDKVLKDAKIKVFNKFSKDNINFSSDLIVYSTAYNEENNVELKELRKMGEKIKKKTMPYAKALGRVFNEYKGISVCGSHGNTTVSAFLGYVLKKAEMEPNVLVGSRVPQFKGSTLTGDSDIFIAETDEYQNKLKYFKPYGVLLNNIDYDHPDFFKDENDYIRVFKNFVQRIDKNGFLVLNGGDKNCLKVAKMCKSKVIKYNVVSDLKEAKDIETVNYLAYDLEIKGDKQVFKVNNLGEFKIQLFGRHNVLNALSVIATSIELGLEIESIKKIISSFKGTERRLQKLGEYNKALIIDDYAHHPTEIKATLQALSSVYKSKNIITVFHPHTFSRTKALFSDFVTSFSNTNELIILDIYGSAREEQGGISSLELVESIKEENKKNKIKMKVRNIKTISKVSLYLRKNIGENDVVVLMGAGDVFRVYNKLSDK